MSANEGDSLAMGYHEVAREVQPVLRSREMLMRPSNRDSDQQTILEIDERWIDAFNAGDVDTLVSIYAPDVIVMPPSEPTIEGRQAVREWIERLFDRNAADQRLFNDEVVVAGDWAFMRGHFTLVVTPRDGGEPIRQQGKHLVIWRRQPDGSWKASRDIWNMDAP